MKTVLKILRFLLIAVLTLLGIGFFLPGASHLERTLEISAPAQSIFNQVNELKNWNNWSPWAKLDPNMQMTYSQPSSAGMGAYYTWSSEQGNIGKGKLTIIDAKPNENVRYKLEFDGMGESFADFKLAAKDSLNTKVTWTMDSDYGLNVISRWFGFLFIEKYVGADYDKGLANLKAHCESKK